MGGDAHKVKSILHISIRRYFDMNIEIHFFFTIFCNENQYSGLFYNVVILEVEPKYRIMKLEHFLMNQKLFGHAPFPKNFAPAAGFLGGKPPRPP